MSAKTDDGTMQEETTMLHTKPPATTAAARMPRLLVHHAGAA
ncbi:hypothetical protein [Pseudoduganella lutea]|nr:hypothetical protein [Pseudoduganella lutea]